MAVTYKKLFHLMINKGVTNSDLIEQTGCSVNIITRLKRNNHLALDIIKMICRTLHCGVDDILEFIEEPLESADD